MELKTIVLCLYQGGLDNSWCSIQRRHCARPEGCTGCSYYAKVTRSVPADQLDLFCDPGASYGIF